MIQIGNVGINLQTPGSVLTVHRLGFVLEEPERLGSHTTAGCRHSTK